MLLSTPKKPRVAAKNTILQAKPFNCSKLTFRKLSRKSCSQKPGSVANNRRNTVEKQLLCSAAKRSFVPLAIPHQNCIASPHTGMEGYQVQKNLEKFLRLQLRKI